MKILVATKERTVFDILSTIKDAETVTALDTRRLYEAIPGSQLAIVDYDDLVPQPFSTEFVRKLLGEAPLQHCSSAEFLASPNSYVGSATPSRRPYQLPAKRTIAFTSYSGGTGKTSLALDTALHFAAQTKKRLQLPAAVIEFTYGSSALASLVGADHPTLDELVVQPELEPIHFQGATLYPMDYDKMRSLSMEQVGRYCRQQMSHHVLTIVDTIWPHGLVSAIGQEVDLWVVLSTPRVDAIENARKLQQELATDYGSNRVILAVNKMGGMAAMLALMGTRRELELPQVKQSEMLFGGRLGKQVLTYLYNSVWKDLESRRSPRRERRRGKRT
jgi:hypothetical protein